MNWDDMRVFLAVARGETLSAAGRRLRLDPATVSRRVARLEARAGATLFGKTPGGYALTPAGERLLPHAEAAEQVFDAASEAVSHADAGLSGLIRLGAPDGVANYLLPQVTAAIVQENPGLEVQIVALPRVFNLTKREADMAVAVSAPTRGRATVQKIADYQLHLAASEALLTRAGGLDTLADLTPHPLIGYIPDFIFDKELDYLGETGLGPVQLASNSVAVQMNWIRQGAGVGIVHDFAVPQTPGVRRVLVEEVALQRAFYLIRHAADRGRARLDRFATLLTQGLRAEITRLEALAQSPDKALLPGPPSKAGRASTGPDRPPTGP